MLDTVYVVEAMRPDQDEWLASRVFEDRESAERTAAYTETGGKWVARVAKYVRAPDEEQKP